MLFQVPHNGWPVLGSTFLSKSIIYIILAIPKKHQKRVNGKINEGNQMVLKQGYTPLFLQVVWYHIEDEISPESPPKGQWKSADRGSA